MKLLANSDCQLDHGATSQVSGGSFVVTSSPSSDVEAPAGKGVFFEKIDFTFSGGNGPGCDPGTVTGSGSVLASGVKVVDSVDKSTMRVDDETVTGPFQGTKDGSPVSLGNQPVKVSSAGQSKVEGN